MSVFNCQRLDVTTTSSAPIPRLQPHPKVSDKIAVSKTSHENEKPSATPQLLLQTLFLSSTKMQFCRFCFYFTMFSSFYLAFSVKLAVV